MSNLDDLRVLSLFEPDNTVAWGFLTRYTYPWEALKHIKDAVLEIGANLSADDYEARGGNVWVHKSAKVAPSAFFAENIIIGAGTEVRHGAFLRGPAIVGDNAVVGNSSELKNVILFNNVQVPHFNYIGDSIFGFKSHTGAGAITSNVKNDHSLVTVKFGDERIETGLKKFGAILGDHVEIGCNTVMNPGTVIGPRTSVYPLSMVRGFVKADSIYKKQGEVVERIF